MYHYHDAVGVNPIKGVLSFPTCHGATGWSVPTSRVHRLRYRSIPMLLYIIDI